jgi:hypothetical protein
MPRRTFDIPISDYPAAKDSSLGVHETTLNVGGVIVSQYSLSRRHCRSNSQKALVSVMFVPSTSTETTNPILASSNHWTVIALSALSLRLAEYERNHAFACHPEPRVSWNGVDQSLVE